MKIELQTLKTKRGRCLSMRSPWETTFASTERNWTVWIGLAYKKNTHTCFIFVCGWKLLLKSREMSQVWLSSFFRFRIIPEKRVEKCASVFNIYIVADRWFRHDCVAVWEFYFQLNVIPFSLICRKCCTNALSMLCWLAKQKMTESKIVLRLKKNK